MRQFLLRNGNGAEYSLMDVTHWLNSPKGLGLKYKNSYSQVGSNFIKTKTSTNPKNPSGTIIFSGGNVYDKYQEFMFFTAGNLSGFKRNINQIFSDGTGKRTLKKRKILLRFIFCHHTGALFKFGNDFLVFIHIASVYVCNITAIPTDMPPDLTDFLSIH